jgi:hypothetical protein
MPTLTERFSTLWSGKERAPASLPSLSLQELADDYDVIQVVDEPGAQFAIVTRRSATGIEIGSSSPSPWTSFTRQEYNPALQGIKGLEVFDKMRKSDGTVRGTLRSIKTPALSGRWFIQPARPYGASDADLERYKMQARWVWRNLTELMSISWTQVLVEAMLMYDFGYYMFEKVWENQTVEGELRTVLTKLAPRHPMDVQEWLFDAHGGPLAVHMQPPSMDLTETPYVKIDIDKLLVFTFDREAGNIEGISVLRSAYKHWYFMEQLYKIDAIQKERHGIGIPVIELPMGFKDADKLLAEELGRNIRTNERAHIVLPPSWKVYMLKMEGQPVDALKSIETHKAAIRENILVNFIGEGAREEDLTMFLKSARVGADIVADDFNLYLIKQMIQYNWPLEECFPTLKVRRIGESADWRTLTFGIRNLVGAGVIIPDLALEENLREEMDLPDPDFDTARLIATPQNPYDDNENELGQQDNGVDQRVGADSGDGEGDKTHNQNNPLYNRRSKQHKKAPGKKQRGQVAGLPRQANLARGGAMGIGRSNGGNDRSGG